MRKSIIAAVLSLVALTSTAHADSRDFTLYNYTKFTISGFYFSVRGMNHWVPMQGEKIGPGTSRHVHFDQTGPCDLQFRVETSNGLSADFLRPFDFCTVNSVSIYYDTPTETFTAKAR